MLPARHRQLINALYERGAYDGRRVTAFSLTVACRSSRDRAHSLPGHGGRYGATLKALERQGYVQSRFSRHSGVDDWGLTERGRDEAERLFAQPGGPAGQPVRSRLSGLADTLRLSVA